MQRLPMTQPLRPMLPRQMLPLHRQMHLLRLPPPLRQMRLPLTLLRLPLQSLLPPHRQRPRRHSLQLRDELD